jgi:O-antigen/teichoic acid export membrane protein
LFYVLSAVIIFLLFREYIRRFCFARLEFRSALIIDLGIAVVQLPLLLIAIYYQILSVHVVFCVVGLACGLICGLWIFNHRIFFDFDLKQSSVDFFRNWNFGKWIFGSGLLWTGSMNLYPWMLAAFHGAAETGVWAACFAVSSVANPVILGVQNLIGPKLAISVVDDGIEGLVHQAHRFARWFALNTLPFVVVFFFFGGSMVRLIYGEAYAGHGSVVAVLGIGLLISAFRIAYSRGLFAIEASKQDFLANLGSVIFMCTFGIVLVSSFGVLGAALALVLGNLMVTVIKVVAFVTRAARLEQGNVAL